MQLSILLEVRGLGREPAYLGTSLRYLGDTVFQAFFVQPQLFTLACQQVLVQADQLQVALHAVKAFNQHSRGPSAIHMVGVIRVSRTCMLPATYQHSSATVGYP